MATLEDYDASGALLIWHDVVIGRAADVARWYNCEHHLERLSIPGFERVTRGHAISARAREFFVLYETENPGVLRSEDYLSRLSAPTMWTRKTMTSFRNNSRTVCKVTSQLGYADGGALATLSLRDRTSARWALETMSQTLERAYSSGEILRAIVTEPIGETDDVAATTELGLRGRPDSHTAGTAIVVASTPAEASAALEKLTRSLHPTVHDDLFESGVYATTFALRARDLALGSSQTV
jgi:hypothetical protein